MSSYEKRVREVFDRKSNIDYIDYIKEKYSNYKYICIFGAGNVGRATAQLLIDNKIKVDFFCDNNKEKIGKIFNGIKCIGIGELVNYKDDVMVVISTRYYKEIFNQLIREKINNTDRIFANKVNIENYIKSTSSDYIINKLNSLFKILDDEKSKEVVCRIVEEWFINEYKYGQLDDIYTENQYFCEDIVNLSEEEVFVDGGAYTGDTLSSFLINCNNKFKKAFLFELNKRNYNKLRINTDKYNEDIKGKIKLFNKGLSDIRKEIFYSDEDESSSIKEVGNLKAEAVNIDSVLKDEKITFIKMDIEGSELKALKGSKSTIKKYMPKLAICLYHKAEDLWEIPLYIKELVPSYKIYIRHHTDLLEETVCYAIPRIDYEI